MIDFPVRAPADRAGRSAWLGPAVSELLQAKLQLFGGARTLDRLRVGALLREAKIDAAGAGDDLAPVAAVVPAEVLIAGSVSVDPKDPQRIRVQARAFETASAKIIADTVFSGTTDLAGLLGITEDLAKTLADGLELSYAPEQLSYAEPAGIDTLTFFVEGEAHLAAGRHRAAIASFQRALEGNAGRYYAAAHRLQGEAYQALAKTAAGEQEHAVREEYLKKFKEDALAAAGAIYDLGLAYEANRMWREAAEAYADYVAAYGERENEVLWRRPSSGVMHDTGGGVVTTVELAWKPHGWTVVDGNSGKTLQETPLPPPPEEGYHYVRAVGATRDRAFLWKRKSVAYFDTQYKRNLRQSYTDGDQFVVALDPAGNVVWQRGFVSGFGDLTHGALLDGKLFLLVQEQDRIEEFKNLPPQQVSDLRRKIGSTTQLVTLDAATGALLSRVVPPAQQALLRGLDPSGATLTVPGGVYDLATGAFDRQAPGNLLPTGRSGISYREEAGGTRLYRGGKEIKFFPESRMVMGTGTDARDVRPEVRAGRLLLSAPKGYLLFDPDLDRVTGLYADFTEPRLPVPVDGSPSLLLFSYAPSGEPAARDSRYGFPSVPHGTVVNVLDPADGRLVAKGVFAKLRPIALLGNDVLMTDNRELARVRLGTHRRIEAVSAAEAHLRVAACSLELGDLPRTREHLTRFDEVFPGDLRGRLLRMRLEVLAGNKREAAKAALAAMRSGELPAAQLSAAVDAYRGLSPTVRAAHRMPVGGEFTFRAVIPPGLVVMTPHQPSRSPFLVRFDTASGQSRLLPLPDLGAILDDEQRTAYSGRFLFVAVAQPAGEGTVRFERVDILTGERVSGPTIAGFNPRFIPGMGAAAAIVGNGRTADLLVLDQADLTVVSRSELGEVDQLPIFVGNGVVVLTRAATFLPEWEHFSGREPSDPGARVEVPLVVLEQATGRELLRTSFTLANERIVAAGADRSRAIVGITGRDFAPAALDRRGIWYRIHALPFSPEGKPWTLEGEGFIGGTMLLHEGWATLPLYEGRLPAPGREEEDGRVFLNFGAYLLPLRAVTLDALTGDRIGTTAIKSGPEEADVSGAAARIQPGTPFERRTIHSRGEQMHYPGPVRSTVAGLMARPALLDTLFVPEALRRLLPGTERSVHTDFPWAHRDLYFYHPDRQPLTVLSEDPMLGTRILNLPRGAASLMFPERISATALLWGDRLYHSLGGGVILEKNLDAGQGFFPEMISPNDIARMLR